MGETLQIHESEDEERAFCIDVADVDHIIQFIDER